MSTSFTPSKDLILQAKIPPAESLFTTFATGHFVRPGKFTQPVKPAKTESFAGAYFELFVAEPIDLDYVEPNAVTQAELELVRPGTPLHQIELPVIDGHVTGEALAPTAAVSTGQRAAA